MTTKKCAWRKLEQNEECSRSVASGALCSHHLEIALERARSKQCQRSPFLQRVADGVFVAIITQVPISFVVKHWDAICDALVFVYEKYQMYGGPEVGGPIDLGAMENYDPEFGSARWAFSKNRRIPDIESERALTSFIEETLVPEISKGLGDLGDDFIQRSNLNEGDIDRLRGATPAILAQRSEAIADFLLSTRRQKEHFRHELASVSLLDPLVCQALLARHQASILDVKKAQANEEKVRAAVDDWNQGTA